MRITPEDAIKHLNEVAEKFHGTRQDHAVLSASVAILTKVIEEWRASRSKDEKAVLHPVAEA